MVGQWIGGARGDLAGVAEKVVGEGLAAENVLGLADAKRRRPDATEGDPGVGAPLAGLASWLGLVGYGHFPPIRPEALPALLGGSWTDRAGLARC